MLRFVCTDHRRQVAALHAAGLAGEPGYQRQTHTLERLSGELAEVLAKLIAADRRHQEAG